MLAFSIFLQKFQFACTVEKFSFPLCMIAFCLFVDKS